MKAEVRQVRKEDSSAATDHNASFSVVAQLLEPPLHIVEGALFAMVVKSEES